MRPFFSLLLGGLVSACATPGPAARPAPAPATDVHLHVTPGSTERSVAGALAALDAAGLDRGVALSRGYHRPKGCALPCPEQRAYTEAANDALLVAAAETSGRLLPFCGLALRAAWIDREARRCAARGASGFKLHPVSEGLSLRTSTVAARFSGVLEVAAEARMPVLVHVAMADAAEVRALFRLSAAHPSAPVIAAHQLAPNLALLAEAPDNLWIEVSGLPMAPPAAAPMFVAAWRAFGLDRVLLGSDWPLLEPRAHLEWLETTTLTAAERARIVRGNAARLFEARRATD